MKEIYEAPELNLISYVPTENLASSFGFEDLLQGNGGQGQNDINSKEPAIDF